jgi:hypothetical protein
LKSSKFEDIPKDFSMYDLNKHLNMIGPGIFIYKKDYFSISKKVTEDENLTLAKSKTFMNRTHILLGNCETLSNIKLKNEDETITIKLHHLQTAENYSTYKISLSPNKNFIDLQKKIEKLIKVNIDDQFYHVS